MGPRRSALKLGNCSPRPTQFTYVCHRNNVFWQLTIPSSMLISYQGAEGVINSVGGNGYLFHHVATVEIKRLETGTNINGRRSFRRQNTNILIEP